MSDLEIGLLGPFQAIFDKQPLNKFRTGKVQALLIYLVVEDALVNPAPIHRREALMAMLWPDLPAVSAQANLRQTLYHLRRTIPTATTDGANHSFVLTDRQTVCVNPAAIYTLDVTSFTQHLHCCQTHSHANLYTCAVCRGELEAAMSLYRGDFLTDFYVSDSTLFEEWALVKRELLRRQALESLQTLSAMYLQEGAYSQTQVVARRQLEIDDLREVAYRQLIEALVGEGRCSEALGEYERCCRRLAEELDIQPSVETIGLAESIRQGLTRASRVVVRPQHSLPQPGATSEFSTTLVGRTSEMETLNKVWQQVKSGRDQMVLVEGEPGIGKTRLVEAFLAERYDQAVVLRAKCPEMNSPLAYTLFVPPLRSALAGNISFGFSEAWLMEISRLLPELRDRFPNLPQPPHLTSAAERRRLFDAVCGVLLALAGKMPLIFFVDDLQWSDATSLALLSHLNTWEGQTPVLVIGAYRPHQVGSEHPLHQTRAVWQHTDTLTTLNLKPLSHRAVSALLQMLTSWPGDDPAFGDLIYRETEGNPLFVVETAASLHEQGCLPDRAEDWQAEFHLERVSIPRQVQRVIENRLWGLAPAIHRLVLEVSVLRSDFSVEMVQAISKQNEEEVLDGLEQLLAAGLLVELDSGRCTFSHDKVREVAYAGLSGLRRRQLHRRVAETLETRYQEQESVLVERLAYHWGQAEESEKSARYLLRAGKYASETYAVNEAINYFQQTLNLLRVLGQSEIRDNWRLQALQELGVMYHYSGKLDTSEVYLRKAIELGHEIGWEIDEFLVAHGLLAATLWHRGKYDDQIQLMENMISNGAEVADLRTPALEDFASTAEAALAFDWLAMAYLGKGEMDKHYFYAFQTSRYISYIPDSIVQLSAYLHSAWSNGCKKDLSKMTNWLQELEKKVIQKNDLMLIGVIHRDMGMIDAWMGDLCGATSKYLQALELCIQNEEMEMVTWCQSNLGECYLLQGDLPKAETYSSKSLEVLKVLGKKDDIAWCLEHIGCIMLARNMNSKALDAFQQATLLYQEVNLAVGEARTTCLTGQVYLAQGNQAAALKQFQRAMELLNHKDILGYIYRPPGNIAWYPLITCLLSGLETAYKNSADFQAFCQRWQEEHPEINDTRFVQWYLEPADVEALFPPACSEEDFDKLGAGWQWQDEFEDCSFTVQHGLEIRASNGRDLWHLNMSAPRLVRMVSGDFAMQTCCRPVSEDQPGIGGLVLWKDRENFLRLDRGMWGHGEIFFGGVLANEDIVVGRGCLNSTRIFLRMERSGDKIRALCSQDGEKWFATGQVHFPVEYPLEVGLQAIGHIDRTIYPGAHPQGTAILFEEFWSSM